MQQRTQIVKPPFPEFIHSNSGANFVADSNTTTHPLDGYNFGSIMPGRNSNSGDYRYGFNGMEKDDEVNNVTGSHYTTFHRGYDSRLGRWWSLDPKMRSNISMYSAFSNNPIIKVDPRGDDDYFDIQGNFLFSTATKTDYVMVINLSQSKVNEVMTTSSTYMKDLESKSAPLSKYNDDKYSNLYGGIAKHYNNNYDGEKITDAPIVTEYSASGAIGHSNKKGQIGITYDYTGEFSTLLNTGSNFANLLSHENKHWTSHQDKSTEMGTPEGSKTHLESYMAQVKHKSWKNTTQEWKDHHTKMIKLFLNDYSNQEGVEYEDYSKLKSSFEKQLKIKYGDDDGTYEKVNWKEK
ncbi:MAG: hypothetical protein J5I47_04725 [Vicingus serpentipes]|nr:hypothetical protein [Vicingus serpentipes]